MVSYPRVSLLVLAAAVALTLGGCFAADPEPSPSPVASADPVFASEEEALAAATEAYAAYLAVADEILGDGGKGAERLNAVATPSVASSEIEGFEQFATNRWHLVGKTQIDRVRLQKYSPLSPAGSGIVSIYLCVDQTYVDVLDENGVSVVSESRRDRTPFQAEFDVDADDASQLIVSSNETWTGDDFCA